MANESDLLKEILAEEILEVRGTGRTNMFDINAVMRIADELELYHLVVWLSEKENHNAYLNFILKGVID